MDPSEYCCISPGQIAEAQGEAAPPPHKTLGGPDRTGEIYVSLQIGHAKFLWLIIIFPIQRRKRWWHSLFQDIHVVADSDFAIREIILRT